MLPSSSSSSPPAVTLPINPSPSLSTASGVTRFTWWQPCTQPNISHSSRWYLHAWKRPYLLYPVSRENLPNICLINNGPFSSFFTIAAISLTVTLYAWFCRLSISIILISMRDTHKKHSCHLALTCPQMESVPHTLHASIVSHVWLVTDWLFRQFQPYEKMTAFPQELRSRQATHTHIY